MCLDGFALKSPPDGICYSCDITCRTCQALSQSDCVTCPITRRLTYNNAGPGICLCILGFKEQNPRQGSCVVGDCAVVTPGCINCDVNGCTQCSWSLNFNPVPVAKQCTCMIGYYFNPSTSTCVPCKTACASCGPGGVCSTCYKGAIFSVGECFCPTGTYVNKLVESCIACSVHGCLTCESDTCTACQRPWIYINGGCVCPDQTYLLYGQCTNCPTGCGLCSVAGCSLCIPNYFMLNGVCTNNCPDTFVGVDGVCVTCPTNCKTCSS